MFTGIDAETRIEGVQWRGKVALENDDRNELPNTRNCQAERENLNKEWSDK